MKYWAFLSYSHTDRKWGDWLHKSLETYRVPHRLIGQESRDGKVPPRLHPIFRDREELPVSADLGANINEALRESRYLIVICSPRAAQSRWVGEEIKEFKRLGREDRILALIIDGEPNASDGKPGFGSADECFPEPMRYRLGADGQFSSERTEPIAADAREGKDGKNNARLKLLAGLLGVNYDDLKQREQERKVRRTRAIAFSLLILVGAFAALAIALFFKEREARAQQAAAEHARGEAHAQQVAAEQSRDEATRSRDEASRTLSHSDFLQALRSLDEDKALNALAQLARSLQFDPSNQAAACRLATLMAYREYPTLVLELEHRADVSFAQFSPSADRILTISGKEVRIWDTRTGKALGAALKHDSQISSALFSHDSARIVTGAEDYTARVWDAVTGKPLTQPLKHDFTVSCVEFSPDDKHIVTASPARSEGSGQAQLPGQLRLWDLRSGTELWRADGLEITISSAEAKASPLLHGLSPGLQPIKLRNDARSLYAHFSPDGKRIVWDARIWDAQTGKPLNQPLEGELSARFSPDGKRIAAGFTSSAAVWDVETGKRLTADLNVGGTVTQPVQFSSDGTRVIASGCFRGDCTTQLWYLDQIDVGEFRAIGGEAEFSPDCKTFLTIANPEGLGSGSRVSRLGGELRLWNAGWIRTDSDGGSRWDNQAAKPANEPVKHPNPVRSAHFSVGGNLIVTASGTRARVWSLQRGKPLGEPLIQEDAELTSAHFSPDGAMVVTTTAGNNARLWDARTGSALGNAMKHGGLVLSTVFSHDGRKLLTTARDMKVRIWDTETRNPVVLTVDRIDRISSAEFSVDSQYVVTATGPNVQLWDCKTGEAVGKPMKHDLDVSSAHLSADGRWIATVASGMRGDSSVQQAQLWNARTCATLRPPLLGISSISFSPDSERFVAANEAVMQIFDVQTGNPLTESVSHVHPRYGTKVRFSSDGTAILAANPDESRVWDGKTLRPITERISDEVEFSRDGKWLVGSKIWDAATGKILSEISGEINRDGTRALRFSGTRVMMWDIVPATKAVPKWFSKLAVAIAGQRWNDHGVFESVDRDQIIEEVKRQLNREPLDADWAIWGRWFLADRSTRTISPFSKITVPEYIENRIKENTAESLDEAEELALGNTELLNRIANARAILPKSQASTITPTRSTR